jgi:precorrin-6B methylase 2
VLAASDAGASIGKQDIDLDVGCGGGRTVSKLAAIATQGKVYGIDHSEVYKGAEAFASEFNGDSSRV